MSQCSILHSFFSKTNDNSDLKNVVCCKHEVQRVCTELPGIVIVIATYIPEIYYIYIILFL